MQAISFDDIIQGGVVRVKDGDLPLISVIDVIKVVTGKNNDDSGKTFRRICENIAVRSKCPDWQFPGERQRPTPVADLDTILIILQHLPGPSAQKYRETVAVKLRNAIAAQNSTDNLTHIAKKTKNAKGDSFHLPKGQTDEALTSNSVPELSTDDALLNHQIQAQSKTMQVELHMCKLRKEIDTVKREINNLKMENAENALDLVYKAKEAFISVSIDEALCPTAANILKDEVANIVKTYGINPNQPVLVASIQNGQGFQESPFHPTTISDRVRMLGYKFDKKAVMRTGQIVSAEYKKIHGKDPMKDKRLIDGCFKDVNVYTNEDVPILDAAIHKVFEELRSDACQSRMDSFVSCSQP